MTRDQAMSALLSITDAEEVEEMIFDYQNGATFYDAEVAELLKIVTTSVTLVRGQSINLTTGVVTESDTPKVEFPCHQEGLRMNDLGTLASLLRCNASLGLIDFA